MHNNCGGGFLSSFGVLGLTLMPCATVMAGTGVDDLRGRWDLTVEDGGSESAAPCAFGSPCRLYVNDLGSDPDQPDQLVAAGCMMSEGGSAPLALRASRRDGGGYDLAVVATVIPLEDGAEPYLVRFLGGAEMFGSGVADDRAGGDDVQVGGAAAAGSWQATHHDRRRKKCPQAQIPPLELSVDVSARVDIMEDGTPAIATVVGAITNIASSALRVRWPDGTTQVAPPYTDIFSPDVDFLTRFRFFAMFEGVGDGFPVAGEPYEMTLLDALGNPIPGATVSDVWTECTVTPPLNVSASPTGPEQPDLLVQWDPVANASGFDPQNGIGFYQIGVEPYPIQPAPPSEFGSNGILSTQHVVPWGDFSPGDPGTPDGNDLGTGLNRFIDGDYRIRIDAYSYPPEGSGGKDLECVTVDFRESVFFAKSGTAISVTTP